MALTKFVCKTCGETLDLGAAKEGIIRCPYCQNTYTLPKTSSESAVFSFLKQGEHDLDVCAFEEAYAAYEKAVQLDKTEPEAYFGLALAEFKIQYIWDVANNRMQPVCHEITQKLFSENPDYRRALSVATEKQREEYRRRCMEIEAICREFYRLKQSGVDYDCFISVKVTDGATGMRTEDYKTADDIYFELRGKGYKPFFSERELRNVTGADFEARILYALYSSECMLLVCSNEEYLRTRWMKSEYTRFLKLINDEEKESDSITVVYSGSPIERLAGKNGRIQGIDIRALNAMERITDFVERHTPEGRARRERERLERERLQRERENIQPEGQRYETNSQPAAEGPLAVVRKFLDKVENFGRENFPSLTGRQQPVQHNIGNGFTVKRNRLVKYTGSSSFVIIPDGIVAIDEGAFANCAHIKSVIIPAGVTFIGVGAFSGCVNLSSIVISENNKFYKNVNDCIIQLSNKSVIAGCNSSVIPKGVLSVAAGAFRGCGGLATAEIPENVQAIGNSAFNWCVNLRKVTIPSSVSFIGDGAFFMCNNLEEVTIPERFKKQLKKIFPSECIRRSSKCRFNFTFI